MADMNNVVLSGRLTADPQMKTTGNTKLANFTLAVGRRTKKQEGKQDTDFINCVAFGNTAEFAEKYFHKGSSAWVTGSLHINTREENGKRAYYTEVVCTDASFCGASGGNGGQSAGNGGGHGGSNFPRNNTKPAAQDQPAEDESLGDLSSDDLPF